MPPPSEKPRPTAACAAETSRGGAFLYLHANEALEELQYISGHCAFKTRKQKTSKKTPQKNTDRLVGVPPPSEL